MVMFPELNTVSFDAELPLHIEALADGTCPPRLNRETRLTLNVMSAPSDTTEEADQLLRRLEAKLDLVLELSLHERHPQRPPVHSCRIGLEEIAWLTDTAWAVGNTILITFSPNPDSGFMLFLTAKVTECKADTGHNYMVTADIRHALDENTQLLWEKWVFRRHRQDISSR